MSPRVDDNEKRLFSKVSSAWIHAGLALGVKVTAPYEMRSDSGLVTYAAFLPEFGNLNGMLIGVLTLPDHEVDEGAKQAAKRAGMYVSFVNAEIYEEYKKEVFVEALRDWGYFGPEKYKPQWLKQEGEN